MSTSKGPKDSFTCWKTSSDKDHSVSASLVRDSQSATEFSIEDMYEAKMKIFRSSHQCQISLEIAERLGYWIEPNLMILAKAVVLLMRSKISQSLRSAAKQRALKAAFSSNAFIWRALSSADHQPCVRDSIQEASQPFKDASEKISRRNRPERILFDWRGFEKTLIHHVKSSWRTLKGPPSELSNPP